MNPFDYDLHTHTAFSDGRSPVKDMVNAAAANGVKGFVLADHVFSNEGAEKLLASYGECDRSASPVPYLFGCETAVFDESGVPCARPELLQKFELVLMDCNGILFQKLDKTQSPEKLRDILCEVMIRACDQPEVAIMAHPFNFGLNPLNLSLELFDNAHVEKIAEAYQAKGKIFEIMNQMYFWHGNVAFPDFHREYMRILNIFKEAGVRFSIGSDTHSCCGMGCFRWSERAATELGVADQLFVPQALIKE
jgi:histidinol phosphatase-like PHP family hydrolase